MIPVIISGGSGTRLWPVSRASYPKQFCEFYDQSFIKNSIQRLLEFGEPMVLTLESMVPMTMRSVQEHNLSVNQIIAEPMGKNTGPAIALACHLMQLQGKENEIMGVFPADHLILDQESFKKSVELALKVAEDGNIVTLGIEPRYPATGYGYIEVTDSIVLENSGLTAFAVKQFCEKPNIDKAKDFCQTGQHFWNSGMFVFKVSAMIESFNKHQPDIWKRITEIKEDLSNAKFKYANIESISLDYAILEKADNIACIPCSMNWSDVGSWDEISRLSEEMPQYRGESKAQVFNSDSTSNYVFSLRKKVVGLVGVRNLVVVETPDALLISQKGKTEQVKEIVQEVKKAGLSEATEHSFEFRPWGGFEVLSDEKDFKAKKITVDSGSQLSYQSHKERDEHWIVISGEATVTLEGEEKVFKPGEYIYVKRTQKHRVANEKKSPLILIEVQTGNYFGEDDIVRYEDKYNRV